MLLNSRFYTHLIQKYFPVVIAVDIQEPGLMQNLFLIVSQVTEGSLYIYISESSVWNITK